VEVIIFLLITAVAVLTSIFLPRFRAVEVEEVPSQVSIQLKWVYQAQFTGFYVGGRMVATLRRTLKLTSLRVDRI